MKPKKSSARRGQLIEKGDGKWLLRAYAGLAPNGGKRYVSKSFVGTVKKAEAALAALCTDAERGEVAATPNISVADYLTQYIESKNNIRPGTRLDYTTRATRDIAPHLGRHRLAKLTPLQVQQWVTLLSKTQGPRTVRYSYTILASAMKQAVRWGLLMKSPCMANLPAETPSKVDTLDTAQVAALLETSEGKTERAIWVTALGTGMRPEEYLGLLWENVDLSAGTVRVETALNRQEDGSYAMGIPKTRASKRTLHVDPFTLAVLKDHKRTQAAHILKTGPRYDRTADLVFANREGTPLHIANVRAAWYRALKKAGVPKVKLYATRHTHASRLIENNAQIKAVSERLGHASIQITLDTYVQTNDAIHAATAALVTSSIFSHRSSAAS